MKGLDKMKEITFKLNNIEKATCDYEKLSNVVKELSWDDVYDFIENASFEQKDFLITYYDYCVIKLEQI